MSNSDLRKKLKAYHQAYIRAYAANAAQDNWRQPYPSFPDECRGMICGAKNRKGTPCKKIDLYTNGRCKFHGGLSSGPKTEQGKQRASQNGHQPKKRTP